LSMEAGLESRRYFQPPGMVFPFGAHVAVVEVDPETGSVTLQRYVSVDGPELAEPGVPQAPDRSARLPCRESLKGGRRPARECRKLAPAWGDPAGVDCPRPAACR